MKPKYYPAEFTGSLWHEGVIADRDYYLSVISRKLSIGLPLKVTAFFLAFAIPSGSLYVLGGERLHGAAGLLATVAVLSGIGVFLAWFAWANDFRRWLHEYPLWAERDYGAIKSVRATYFLRKVELFEQKEHLENEDS